MTAKSQEVGFERLVDAKELSEMTGVPRPTIYRLMSDGSLPFIQVTPHRKRIRPIDWAEYCADHTESRHVLPPRR